MYRWCALAALAAASGCFFSIRALPGPSDDAATPDDAAPPVGDDLGSADPGDLAPIFQPSHVDPGYWHPAAPALSAVTALDTLNLTMALNGGAAGAPPPGITFVRDPAHGFAVLSVGAWNVDQNVAVTGSAALVVVASGEVILDAVFDGTARHHTPGPGGLSGGSGAGGNGSGNGSGQNSGGGGAGFGGNGESGGDSNGSPKGGSSGVAFGDQLAQFGGGSGGGKGGDADQCGQGSAHGQGGGGGGAIQISSSVAIMVGGVGGIQVGGGGGSGGCGSQPSAGGGGGSGGTIFLEAPTVQVNGRLTANGGGGGGGGVSDNIASSNDGSDGSDGKFSNQLAGGGTGGALFANPSGGDGGNGATGTLVGTPGGKSNNGGGGGGGVGRIWLRTRGTPATSAGMLSPPAMLSTSL